MWHKENTKQIGTHYESPVKKHTFHNNLIITIITFPKYIFVNDSWHSAVSIVTRLRAGWS
jgi:hypothetical protein